MLLQVRCSMAPSEEIFSSTPSTYDTPLYFTAHQLPRTISTLIIHLSSLENVLALTYTHSTGKEGKEPFVICLINLII